MENHISTTIEQSKHLLELGLDPNTADMFWAHFNGEDRLYVRDMKYQLVHKYQVCVAWSLSALLEVIPKGTELIKMQNNVNELYYEIDYMYIGYEDSDPITAAYEMVCWLLENNLIKKGGEQ